MLPLNILGNIETLEKAKLSTFVQSIHILYTIPLIKYSRECFLSRGPDTSLLAVILRLTPSLHLRQCSVIEFYPKFYRNFVISSYGRFPCSSSSCINVIFIGYLLISTALIVCHCQIKCQCHCLSQTLVNSNVQSQCDLTLNEKNGSSDFFLYATIRNMFFHIVFNYFPHSPVHSFVRWGGWLRSLHLAVFP